MTKKEKDNLEQLVRNYESACVFSAISSAHTGGWGPSPGDEKRRKQAYNALVEFVESLCEHKPKLNPKKRSLRKE
jgi:hypothetical protein